METPLPPAEELALIDRELAQLDARRHHLLGRRQWLLGAYAAQWAPQWAPPGAPRPAKEASAPSAQNVLLTLGAVLLAVAALAFTLVSWGSLGIAGRASVLAAVTAAALAAPVPLLRRSLRSTAESVAAVGLLLTVLDAYALYVVALPDIDALAYAAGSAAVLAGLWAAYGRALPGLRLPRPVALLTAQLPLPLAALASAADPTGIGWALWATAVCDTALALRGRARAALAWTAAAVLGAGALLVGLTESADAASAGGAAAPSALLAAVAALGLAAAWRAPAAWPAATSGGVALVAALGGPARPALAPGWAVVAYLLVALGLLGALRVPALPRAVRRGLVRAGAGVAAAAAVWALASVAVVLAARLRVLEQVWAAATPPAAPYRPAAAVVALLLTAAAAWWLARALPARREPGAAAVALGWAGLFAAPPLLAVPAAGAYAWQLAVTVAAGALALRSAAGAPGDGAAGGGGGLRGISAGACALLGALNVSVAALDGRLATFAVFGALGAAGAAGAAYGRGALWARRGAAALAVAYAAGLVVALGALLELPVAWWGPPLLGVPAAVAALGPRLGAVRPAAEAAAAAAGVLAVALAVGDAPVLALVLALAGAVCAGAAVRPERRAAGWAAGALFLAATWVRLAASGVAVPEAYSLPATAAALAVGGLRRRKDPRASSWSAYGPGLAATMLPSLLMVWGDAYWPRPLLLGLAALAVTLAGARSRLQAPLVLGGATLAAVAVHELAPYVVQVVDALPRWLPPALAGLLLLAVGATYEKRLRDARRLREALGRLG
ncbi:SCO7613 C-terminal domain-containing membrane protein [Streptomyces sp. NPDC091268]|uniref:SCO7613 C-terminal domain-containing membrane protein n=1 Tax=Streptomyces sp. NPDC091268 TaxID=3365979 RepID=UPI003830F921